MVCPFIFAANQSKQFPFDAPENVCLLEECGRFDENTGVCSDVAIARELAAAGNVLGKISDTLELNRYHFRCHYCGLTLETSFLGKEDPLPGWSRTEQVDGRFVWSCDRCQS